MLDFGSNLKQGLFGLITKRHVFTKSVAYQGNIQIINRHLDFSPINYRHKNGQIVPSHTVVRMVSNPLTDFLFLKKLFFRDLFGSMENQNMIETLVYMND